jgi:hypothetical protein
MQGMDGGGNREWMTTVTRKEKAVTKARKGLGSVFIPWHKANGRIRQRGK